MEKADRRWSPLFTNFRRNSFQTAQYLHNFAFTIVEPLHVLTRKYSLTYLLTYSLTHLLTYLFRHSYLHDDFYVASTGVRITATIVTWFIYWFCRSNIYMFLLALFYNSHALNSASEVPTLHLLTHSLIRSLVQ